MFNLKEGGNFEEEIRGRKTGTNLFYMVRSPGSFAAELKVPVEEVEERVKRASEKLLAARYERIRPSMDDKVLTDWNGLMIAAFAKGFQVFGEQKYLKAAEKAADFIMETLYSYEAGFQMRHLKAAVSLNIELFEYFWDPASGGFHFTASDSESLLFRKKESTDAAIPSGNSVEMLNLLRISRIIADPELEETADRLERAFSKLIKKAPSGYTQFLSALDFRLGPSYEVIISGKRESPDTVHMLEELWSYFVPNKVLVFRPEEENPEIAALAKYTKEQLPIEGKTTAYVCQNYECQLPTTETSEMLRMLDV